MLVGICKVVACLANSYICIMEEVCSYQDLDQYLASFRSLLRYRSCVIPSTHKRQREETGFAVSVHHRRLG